MKVIKWIYAHAEEVILCILLTAIVLFSGAQVVSRYVFGNSLTWSEELCRYLYVWSGFMTVSYCIRSGSIIKIDTVVMFLPKMIQKALNVVTTVISFLVVAFLFKASLGVVSNVITTGQLTSAMRLPIWLVYICAPMKFAWWSIWPEFSARIKRMRRQAYEHRHFLSGFCGASGNWYAYLSGFFWYDHCTIFG